MVAPSSSVYYSGAFFNYTPAQKPMLVGDSLTFANSDNGIVFDNFFVLEYRAGQEVRPASISAYFCIKY
jgi:hypothetical protein